MNGQLTKASANHATPFSVKDIKSYEPLGCDHAYTSLLMMRSPGVTWVIDHILVEGFKSSQNR